MVRSQFEYVEATVKDGEEFRIEFRPIRFCWESALPLIERLDPPDLLPVIEQINAIAEEFKSAQWKLE